MAKLKSVADQNPVQASLSDPRFKPHEFETIEELWAKRYGWIPPSKRQHRKARGPGEKTAVFVGRIGYGGKFVPEPGND
jgi:broad specificity phosphatase PhoE